MAAAFADAYYYIALLLPGDADHARVVQLGTELQSEQKVTSDAVFVEVLAYVSSRGPALRKAAVELIRDQRSDKFTQVIPQTRELFDRGLALYAQRADKGYSHTDCVSMLLCRDLGIVRVLTRDHHFEQEGFAILF